MESLLHRIVETGSEIAIIDITDVPTVERMGRFLLITIQVEMDDEIAIKLEEDLTKQIEKTGARGPLIGISAVETVDSFIGRMIGNISAMSHILDARMVVVGRQPAVAIHFTPDKLPSVDEIKMATEPRD